MHIIKLLQFFYYSPAKPKNIELNLKAPQSLDEAEREQDSLDKTAKINFSIANKISMFENKRNHQNQSSEVSASKKGSVSSTFVGRAKLKFGKQPTESEQNNRITNKPNNRQKSLQNGTKMKESSSDVKIKSDRGTQGVTTSCEVETAAESQSNQNGKVDDNQVSACASKRMDTETAKGNILSKTVSLSHSEESETSPNSINRRTNAGSTIPENGEKLSLITEIYSPCKDDLMPRKSELEHNMTSHVGNKSKKTNNVLNNIQMFEQSISEQQSPGSSGNVSKANNDNSICDSPSDMEKFTETLKNLDSSVCIPQKKKKSKVPRSPAPHFAMPPIHEDNLEKVFDPNIFTVGLGIKRDKPQDLAPSLQLKMQSLENEARTRPKRASAENSILLQSLKTSSRADPTVASEISGKESKNSTDGDVKRSRLENSAIFSSLLLPGTKEKVFMPSATSVNAMTTSFASQKGADPSGIPPLRLDRTQISEVIELISNRNHKNNKGYQ